MPIPLIWLGGGVLLSGAAAYRRLRARSHGDRGKATSATCNEQAQAARRQRRDTIHTGFAVASGAALSNGAAALLFPPMLVIGLPLTAISASYILEDAIEGLMQGKVRASVVDTLGIVGTIGAGYFFTSTIFDVLYFLGKKIQLRTEEQTQRGLREQISMQADAVVSVIDVDGRERVMPLEQVHVGHIVVVRAGESIPVDGTVVHGAGSVDQQILNGESMPREKSVGEAVHASTVLIAGQLKLRADQTGSETTAAKIAVMLDSTEDFIKGVEIRSVELADQMALPTLLIGGVALIFISPMAAIAVTTTNFVDVARATLPLGLLQHIKRATHQAILIKDGRALEQLGKVDTVVFDKTGTLTLDRPQVGRVHAFLPYDEDEIVRLAGGVEARQSHPIARAIEDALRLAGLQAYRADAGRVEMGFGVAARIGGRQVLLGSERFLRAEGVGLGDGVAQLRSRCHARGDSLVYLAVDGRLAGVLELHASPRPQAVELIQALRRRGLRICIVSGDQEEPTRQLAQRLGVHDYFAQTLPQEKALRIAELQRQGRSVCFVGDGINDTIAMKKAQVSVSLAGASSAATDTANVILLDRRLMQLDHLFELSASLQRNLDVGMACAVVPGAINVGSVFLLHARLPSAVGLYLLGSAASVVNAVLPALAGNDKTSAGAAATKSARRCVSTSPNVPARSACQFRTRVGNVRAPRRG